MKNLMDHIIALQKFADEQTFASDAATAKTYWAGSRDMAEKIINAIREGYIIHNN